MKKIIILAVATFYCNVFWAQPPATLTPLYSWYSSSRGDYLTTSDPAWAGNIGDVKHGQGDYKCLGTEGYVYSPDAEKPRETSTLYSWWSESRKDNFLTTDPAWAGRVGDVKHGQGDYKLYRIEGFIPVNALAGTYPLQNYWSSGKKDNYANANPNWFGRVGDNTPRAGEYIRIRNEGFVFGPQKSPANERFLTRYFHYDRLHTPRTTGMLVVLWEWSDLRFENPAARLAQKRQVFSTTGVPNLTRYISQASGGNFTWAPIVVHNRIVSAPITIAEADRRLTADPGQFRKWELQMMADNGVDFSRFDRNRDGNVTGDELVVQRYGAGAGSGGQNGMANDLTVGGVTVKVSVNNVSDSAALTNAGHEGLHAFGAEDVYGPGRNLNYRTSVMAANLGEDDNRFYLPDPWHRMQFGWIKPEVHVISPSAQNPGKVFQLINATSVASPSAPICVILTDPDNHPNEYFMLEYRNQCPGAWSLSACNGYADNGVADNGLAIWHVMVNSNGTLRNISRRDDRAGLVAWPGGLDMSQQVSGVLNVGSPGRMLGGNLFWRESHGEIPLRWFDNTDTKVRLKVGTLSPSATSLMVQMYLTDTKFLTAIKKPVSSSVRKGSLLVLDGTFAINKNDYVVKIVPVTGGTLRTTLTVNTWSTQRISVNIPTSIASGNYYVFIEERSGSTHSNMIKFEVR